MVMAVAFILMPMLVILVMSVVVWMVVIMLMSMVVEVVVTMMMLMIVPVIPIVMFMIMRVVMNVVGIMLVVLMMLVRMFFGALFPVFVVDGVEVTGVDPAFVAPLENQPQPALREGDPLQARLQFLDVGPEIEQGSHGHVAGDSRKRVPIDGAHEDFLVPFARRGGVAGLDCGRLRIRTAATAAPKPLSILTTVIPAEQALSMESSAATP